MKSNYREKKIGIKLFFNIIGMCFVTERKIYKTEQSNFATKKRAVFLLRYLFATLFLIDTNTTGDYYIKNHKMFLI